MNTIETTAKADKSQFATGFEQHVILYAKNWYPKTNNKIEDLKKLLSRYSQIDIDCISDRDIFEFLISTFNKYVTNEYERNEGLLEMLGKKWFQGGIIPNRSPEDVMLGKISIIDGKYVDKDEIFK